MILYSVWPDISYVLNESSKRTRSSSSVFNNLLSVWMMLGLSPFHSVNSVREAWLNALNGMRHANSNKTICRFILRSISFCAITLLEAEKERKKCKDLLILLNVLIIDVFLCFSVEDERPPSPTSIRQQKLERQVENAAPLLIN